MDLVAHVISLRSLEKSTQANEHQYIKAKSRIYIDILNCKCQSKATHPL